MYYETKPWKEVYNSLDATSRDEQENPKIECLLRNPILIRVELFIKVVLKLYVQVVLQFYVVLALYVGVILKLY